MRIHILGLAAKITGCIAVTLAILAGSVPVVGFAQQQPTCPTGENLLGFYSNKNMRLSSENRIVFATVGESLRQGYGLRELAANVSITITTLDPLPSGLSLKEEVITYFNNISTLGNTNQGRRFSVVGTPAREGVTNVRLRATSSLCGTDDGLIVVTVSAGGGVSCTLSNNGPIAPGSPATLSWNIFGPATGGSMNPGLTGSPNFAGGASANSAPLSQDTTFTFTVNGPINSSECSTRVVVGGWSAPALEFKKTILEIPTVVNGGVQGITSALYMNGRFVYSGHCGVAMNKVNTGGGLWSIKEDGSGPVQERQMCLDAGSITNSIFHHAIIDGTTLPDGNKGFIRETASWASCIGGNPRDNFDCRQYGPGANRAIYYEVSASEGVTLRTLSPEDRSLSTGLTVGNGFAIGNATRAGWTIARLPEWSTVGTAPTTFSPILGYNKYILGRNFNNATVSPVKVFSVDGGSLREVQDLPGNPTFVYYAYDFSSTPERLVIYQPATRSNTIRRLLTYEPSQSGLRLVKEKVLPASFPAANPVMVKNGFGVWGDYLVWPETNGFGAWKGDQKLATLKMPSGGVPAQIIAAKSGYVTVTTFQTDKATTAAYLYKLTGANPPATPPTPTSTSQTTFTSGTGGSSFGSAIQRQLDQIIDALRKLGITVPTSTPAR